MAAPVGKYSHLAEPPAGHRLVFVSGQVGAHPDGSVPADAKEQTRLVFANLRVLLDELGAGPEHLVKLLTFVAGTESLPGWAEARDDVYAQWYPDGSYPAHSLAVVTALARHDLLVETEGVIVVPGDS
ncbi:endoribonuclease [Streptomyces sp. 150FB]|uniref:RidA family protein n=1 Tax=Streptomyces sp. 150FB TaxID=1576605 RepID=UPI000588EBA8|nr:RidA family protein [Streptomyces sp. 150FB]KIF77562.1 endoribonuclease [Streptomyces sp. 150FB]